MKMKTNKITIKIAVLICVIISVSLISSCIRDNEIKTDPKTENSDVKENSENTENNNPSNKETNNPIEEDNKNEAKESTDSKNENYNNNIIVPPNIATKPPSPSIPSDTSISEPVDTKDGLGDYWFELNSVVSTASKYYFENFNTTRLISYNGRLYNKSSATYIDTAYLYEYENLNDRFRWVSADILLMFPSDLKAYPSLNVNVSGNDLTVFGARRHPSENKYLISSPNGNCGIISAEEYRELLTKYLSYHGEIYELSPTSDTYNRIIKFINMYEGGQNQYYPRNIICDEKYVFATVSTTSNTADVKQYILRKEGSVYKVVMDGIEKESRAVIAINKKIPDYNLDLYPNFSVYNYRNYMKTNFNDVIDLLKQEQYIGNYTDIKYICGTTEFCYVVTTSNVKYLLSKKGDLWIPQRVSTSYEAKTILKNSSQDPPLFIVLDQ